MFKKNPLIFQDATNFLATYGFVKNCPMCLTVKTVVKKSPLKMFEVLIFSNNLVHISFFITIINYFSYLQDNDFHFPEVLVKAANMLLDNTGFQKALKLEEEMRKSSLVHLAISTAKTILYYTPVIFVTR